ncbi:MAG: hypothetical protein KU38_05275 [Sulfurovum sp. FS08-3]|nr:MAG: hypothetical protein KU38_05275 [Sulfurovum sp. FS08-3]
MKKLLLFIFLVLYPLYGELPPLVYHELQENSPEVVTLQVLSVKSKTIASAQREIALKAKVLKVERTQSALVVGSIITIRYTTTISHPAGWVGPSPLPVLSEKHSYKAFLTYDKANKRYAPSAGGKSFIGN